MGKVELTAEQERSGKYSVDLALCDCDDNCRRPADVPGPSAMQGRIDRGLADDSDFQDQAKAAEARLIRNVGDFKDVHMLSCVPTWRSCAVA